MIVSFGLIPKLPRQLKIQYTIKALFWAIRATIRMMTGLKVIIRREKMEMVEVLLDREMHLMIVEPISTRA